MRASILSVLTASAIIVPLMLSLPTLAQEATWLDGDYASWNTPGMTLPTAPLSTAIPMLGVGNGSVRPNPTRTTRSSPQAVVYTFLTSAAGE